jgi:hypothetical protein
LLSGEELNRFLALETRTTTGTALYTIAELRKKATNVWIVGCISLGFWLFQTITTQNEEEDNWLISDQRFGFSNLR